MQKSRKNFVILISGRSLSYYGELFSPYFSFHLELYHISSSTGPDVEDFNHLYRNGLIINFSLYSSLNFCFK